jgi:tRNA(adenine34) deaminase
MTSDCFPPDFWDCRMEAALEQARLAEPMDEVPIGAAVFRGEALIASAHDAKESLDDPTAHAEILALRAAGKILGDWRLEGCDLVVTLEPCPMCVGALIQARIARVAFGARNTRWGAVVSRCRLLDEPVFNHRVEAVEGIRAEECAAHLQRYFRGKRGPGSRRG